MDKLKKARTRVFLTVSRDLKKKKKELLRTDELIEIG